MKKMKTLFVVKYPEKQITREVSQGCEWVINGEGTAYRKRDGSACFIQNQTFYKRYDAKKGRTAPDGFIQCGEPDEITGHHPGWVPVLDSDKWHLEALRYTLYLIDNTTYELCGPKVNSNREQLEHHILIPHNAEPIRDFPRDFDGIKAYFEDNPNIEGVVWHHPDGRMCKIRLKDFGIKRR